MGYVFRKKLKTLVWNYIGGIEIEIRLGSGGPKVCFHSAS